MEDRYPGVTTRFLRPDERFMPSEETEMPLVIEAKETTDRAFLQSFLATHSESLLTDLTQYGAVLLRGFDIHSDEDFENTVLQIKGFRGISEAFMSEEGRIHVDPLKYVLYTNAVYKTGGTVYLGGFHSENYYSADVPSYICFYCSTPSLTGGETGLINMQKIYQQFSPALKEKLEKTAFFVTQWLVSEIAERYQISTAQVENLCQQFDLPIIGTGRHKLVRLYKPNVFEHPITKKKSLQINLFELLTLNVALRKCFMKDYPGKRWFWHRTVWKLPTALLKTLEFFYILFASFFYSPKEALKHLRTKWLHYKATHTKIGKRLYHDLKVGSCFNEAEINALAQLMRQHYGSCLWKKGDILLVDNRQVMHAGMPGSGPRLIRALIGNPIEMRYSSAQSGIVPCKERPTETIGFYMAANSKRHQ